MCAPASGQRSCHQRQKSAKSCGEMKHIWTLDKIHVSYLLLQGGTWKQTANVQSLIAAETRKLDK